MASPEEIQQLAKLTRIPEDICEVCIDRFGFGECRFLADALIEYPRLSGDMRAAFFLGVCVGNRRRPMKMRAWHVEHSPEECDAEAERMNGVFDEISPPEAQR